MNTELKIIDNAITNLGNVNPTLIIKVENKKDGDVYYKIEKPGNSNFTGIGWNNKGEYFYHNVHSGSIDEPSPALNGVWNYKEGCFKDRPSGWYTHSMREILSLIGSFVNN